MQIPTFLLLSGRRMECAFKSIGNDIISFIMHLVAEARIWRWHFLLPVRPSVDPIDEYASFWWTPTTLGTRKWKFRASTLSPLLHVRIAWAHLYNLQEWNKKLRAVFYCIVALVRLSPLYWIRGQFITISVETLVINFPSWLHICCRLDKHTRCGCQWQLLLIHAWTTNFHKTSSGEKVCLVSQCVWTI